MTTWAGEVLSKFKVQSTGRTTHEMATGHKCNHLIVGFGEKVHFKVTTDVKNRNKMDCERGIGYFLGVMDRNTQYVISMGDKLYTCTTLKRLLDEEAYDPSIIENVTLTFDDFISNGADNNFKSGKMLVHTHKDVWDVSRPWPIFPTECTLRSAGKESWS